MYTSRACFYNRTTQIFGAGGTMAQQHDFRPQYPASITSPRTPPLDPRAVERYVCRKPFVAMDRLIFAGNT
jgi:hypothetical protein